MLKYSEKVMQHFTKPKNVGTIENADGSGRVGNMHCGDIMEISIKVGKKQINGNETEYIEDIKFQTLGCAAAIATTSMVTELAKGKTIEEAIKLTNKDVTESLGGLPPIKHHCSCLAEEALCEAIYNYLKKQNRSISEELEKKHLKAIESKEEFEKAHKNIE